MDESNQATRGEGCEYEWGWMISSTRSVFSHSESQAAAHSERWFCALGAQQTSPLQLLLTHHEPQLFDSVFPVSSLLDHATPTSALAARWVVAVLFSLKLSRLADFLRHDSAPRSVTPPLHRLQPLSEFRFAGIAPLDHLAQEFPYPFLSFTSYTDYPVPLLIRP